MSIQFGHPPAVDAALSVSVPTGEPWPPGQKVKSSSRRRTAQAILARGVGVIPTDGVAGDECGPRKSEKLNSSKTGIEREDRQRTLSTHRDVIVEFL